MDKNVSSQKNIAKSKLKQASKLVIYYYVDHTCTFEYNTGTQRVTGLLAKSLIENKAEIRLIRWSTEENNLYYISEKELLNINSFGGPKLKDITYYTNENNFFNIEKQHINSTNTWLLIPEVTYINNYDLNLTEDIIQISNQLSLNTAFIYYDSLPIRRDELKDIRNTHQFYMESLHKADLILPISQYSGSDFYSNNEKIQVLHLPAESTIKKG